MSRPRQGRLVVLVNVAVGIGLIVVIASVSLYKHTTVGPTVSEFAPAGGRALTDVQQSATPATPAPVRPSAVALARPSGPGVPRQLACYAWPDGTETQTFDPQSPSCVSRWDVAAGNGGATARGASATTIRVGVPRGRLATLQPYATWFASHFELYGRTLQLVPLDPFDLTSDEGQQAAATNAVQQQVFAVVLTPQATSGPAVLPTQFLEVASAHGIVSLLAQQTQGSSTTLSALSPYAWSYAPGLDVLEQSAGDLVCQVLAGRRATLSPEQAGRQRHFGVVVPDADHAGGDNLDVQVLQSALDDCHTSLQVERVDPTSPADVSEALRRLKIGGVTTVIPYLRADPVARVLMPAAEQLGFRPEWVLSGIDDGPAPATWAAAPAHQLRGLAGLASWQRSASPALRPASQVVSGVDVDEDGYRSLLVLASGVQLAGPHLTADAFGSGLSVTSFPDPGAGRAPLFQAAVGFDDLDHAMVDDIAFTRWRQGALCLVGGGTRWPFDAPPHTDPGLLDPDKECS